MITNANKSKTAATFDFKRYVGVGSVNIVAVNPNNATLRKYGWKIDDGADEPQYVNLQGQDGRKFSRIRFLIQIKDLKDKPVIPYDFRISNDWVNSKDNTKTQVIDDYSGNAYVTKEEFKNHSIPENRKSFLDKDFRRAHAGEVDLINFLFKYFDVTPRQRYDQAKKVWVENKNPGTIKYDWDKLCNGDVSDLISDLSQYPDNCVKVIFGLQTTDENRVYQIFIRSKYIGNGARVDNLSGDYSSAQTEINKFLQGHQNGNYIFSASPIKEWVPESTDVKDNAEDEDMPEDLADGVYNDEDPLPFDV